MLTRLLLTDVRNHAALTLDPAPGFVVLTGENGAGKTNVLEAVSLLAPGRGLRRATLSAVARQGGPGGFAIAATHLPAPRLAPLPLAGGAGNGVVDPIATSAGPPPTPPASGRGEEGAVRIGAGTLAAAPERRVVRINGAPAASTALAEWLTILWVTPAMDRLFTGAAGERRAFLDRLTLALAPAHAGHAARYEAAMRARNRLLADPARSDPEWLSALEAQLAEHGAAIDAARRATVGALGERLGAIAPGPFARAALALEGWSGDAAALAAALRSGRARDAAAGRTLAGPHRTDLVVTHADKQQPAAHCSTGEQKALLLGLVLAHAALVAERSGRPPILLLDEVAAHLDPLRRAALFERLAGQGQVWMTGTEPSLFAGLPEETSWHRLGG